MTLRLSSLRAVFNHHGKGRVLAAAALAAALTGAGLGNALAAQDTAASAPDAASASYAAGSQYMVRPGQSLNDVAIAVTQSHDKATLARASHALFDANPNAFMNHDPSRMRVGAALTVPAPDATGALVASAAAASGPAAGSGAAAVPSTGAAASAAQANATASSATGGASSATAAAAVAGAASAATGASAATSASAAAGSVTPSAPVAGSQPAMAPASGAHEWSGSIQPSASESAASAQAPATAAVSTAATASPASQPKVSSLQQLLALKNRVLMELQKHGIGGAPAAGGAVATNGAAPAAGASTAASVTAGHGAMTAPASTNGSMSQRNLSIAAAVGAALVVLLSALRMRRRKRDNAAAAQEAAADRAAAAQESGASGSASSRDVPAADASPDDSGHAAVLSAAARAAAQREAAEGESAQREAAEREAAEREAENRRAASQAAEEHAAAERVAAEENAAAERAAAERLVAEQAAEQAAADQARAQEAEREALAHRPHDADVLSQDSASDDLDASPEPLPAKHHDTIDSATTAASLAAAAELGADALPLKSLEPVDETTLQEELTRQLHWSDEPAPGASVEQQELSAEPHNNQNVPPPVIDFPQQLAEPHAIVPPGQPFDDVSSDNGDVPLPPLPTMSIPPVPTEFPRDAVDAFSSLDMPLPPRIESTEDDIHAPESLTTQPVAVPETVAQQVVAPHKDDAPHIADEITAGTAGAAAVAGLGATGLGAAGFGALKLDFDLELPPSPAQPWPAFTQTDLIRIARNKLDLATEYIELGDLSGARALINEVIEANDPATRTEARALLSTLAPLS
jgi:pilus assembly protein FimV